MLTPAELEVLGQVRSDVGWQLVETFSSTRRELPHEYEAGAAILAERLDESGLKLTQSKPPLYLGIPRAATIVCNGRTYTTKATALSPKQLPLTAQLVHLASRDSTARVHTNDPSLLFGEGLSGEALRALVAGRVVITEGLSNPGRSALLESLGALAVITANPGSAVHWGASSIVWGNPRIEDMDKLPQIVSMAVSHQDGKELTSLAKQGASVTISADVLHGWFPQTITTVDIEAEGPHADEYVLLHGHLDSWDLGVGDNATGNAVLLETARALNAQRHLLRRSVRIAWWPGHSAGRYAGSTWYADRNAFDLRANCVAHLNCDSPGCKDATDYSSLRAMAEATPLLEQSVFDLFGQRCKLERPSRGGDYSFNNLGVSGAMMASSMVPPEERERRGWYSVGGNGGSPTWHTEDDVLSVADRQVLESDIRLYTLLGSRLALTDTPLLDYRIPLRHIVAQIEKVNSLAGQTIDFRKHVELAKLLTQQVDAAYVPGRPEIRADRWPSLLQAARALVRIGYVESGPFEQDPAYAKPAMPMLAASSHLDKDPAASVSLQRGANALRSELETALDHLSSASK